MAHITYLTVIAALTVARSSLAEAAEAPRPAAIPTTPVAAVPAPPPEQAAPEDESDLVPAGEKQRMARRTVVPDRITFKPGEGVYIASDDQAFSIGFGFRFQLLYTLLNDDPNTGKTDQSFQVRRARLQVAGNG